jgi:hypothetical protein
MSWYTHPAVLFERPLDFFPNRGMTPEERLNSMVRFVLYASIAVSAYNADPMMLALGVCIIIALSLVDATRVKEKIVSTPRGHPEDDIQEPRCTAPTEDNPFMNVLPHEFASNKPAACRITESTMKKTNDYFDRGLHREITDVYHKRASDRQFVTMPASGDNGTPDTLAFRNFLFSETAKGPKCK